jgi:squalene cyclase
MALLTLLRAKSPYATHRAADVVASTLRFQHRSGGFWCFDPQDFGPLNMLSPSVTARACCALMGLGVARDHRSIRDACRWLATTQRPDGSWYDFFGADPIYGVAFALELLLGAGHAGPSDPCAVRALDYVLRAQNADGGWGCDYFGRRTSTSGVESTSVALRALCRLPPRARATAIRRGAAWLASAQRADGSWPTSYWWRCQPEWGYENTAYTEAFALEALAASRDALARSEP